MERTLTFTSEAIVIRPLDEQEWQIFSNFRLAALRERPGVFGSSYEIEKDYAPQDWHQWLKPVGQCSFGLFDGDKLIGITGVMTDKHAPSSGTMIASYILPAYRGRGLSQLFYQARIDWAKHYKPWQKLKVSHRDGNEASRRANQRHGFVFVERRSKVWPDGIASDEFVYELDLNRVRNEHDAAI